MTSGRRWGLVIGALVAVLAIDQWSKRWALERLSPDVVGGTGDIIEVIGPLQFNLAFNTGASFSMGSGSGGLIGLIAIVIVVVLAFMARKVDSRVQLVLIGVIMGGALGNIIDRATRVGEVNPFTGEVATGFLSGAVVDFIDVQFWPIWNVADMAVVCGGIALAVLSAFAPGPDDDPGPEDDSVDGSVEAAAESPAPTGDPDAAEGAEGAPADGEAGSG